MIRTTMHVPFHRRALLAGAAAGVALLLAGCGGDEASAGNTGSTGESSPAAAAAFNDADVMFAQQMIPHHQQVVDMAGMAEKHAKSAELKAIAKDMKASDADMVQKLTTMLTGWGKPTSMEGGMGHGSMPGMTSDSDMKMLESMTGTEFDRMFIQMMIAHHNGSMQMTMEEQSNGSSPEAKAMAKEMHTLQTEQVAQLEKILDGLA